MNRPLLRAACASTVALGLAMPGLAAAQGNAGAAAQQGAKPQLKRMATQPSKRAAPVPQPAEIDLPPAAGEQNAAAAMTYFGDYQCEFDQKLVITMNPKHDAYIDVDFRNRTYTMRPVLSHTGAIRLEDVRGQMLLLQIATKSMMIDTRAGQRVVDGCTHEKQRVFAANAPVGEGIGIDPNRPAPAAATAATTAAPVTESAGAAPAPADAVAPQSPPQVPAAEPAVAATAAETAAPR